MIYKGQSGKVADPVIKLLYSQIWKNGGVPKLEHIARGAAAGDPATVTRQGAVFHQFGVHLADRSRQPIVDQHVIRAYAVFCALGNDDSDIVKALRIGTLKSKGIGS